MTGFRQIDVQRTRELLDTGAAQVVDIRDPLSYGQGHIPSARHLTDSNVEEFKTSADKSRPLVVVCYHGISSQGAAEYFSQAGFQEVYSMAGGFEAWSHTFPELSERSGE